jgi:diguanylate cyclase (GGDEF)-like protein
MDIDLIEDQRLATLRSLQILDTPPEREFDAIVNLARDLLGSQIALISLIDDHRQWFKARVGLGPRETPREHAFCAHAIRQNDMLLVADARSDSRFAANPLVTGDPNIRFYAGMPVRAKHPIDEARIPIGTLCVIGDAPRDLDDAEQNTLRALASIVETLIDARVTAIGATRLAADYQQAVERLDRSHRLFRHAERMAHIDAWHLTLADNNIMWSEGTFAIHGVPPTEAVSLEAALDYYPAKARAAIEAAVADTIKTGLPFDVELDFHDAQDRSLRIRAIGELETTDGEPAAIAGVLQDVTARYVMEQKLRELAETDELTRIASRSRFNAFLDGEIAVARDTGSPLALLLIDLDHFKEVNDRCGHAAGDDLLRLMASRLRASYLDNSFAARLGGDEFVMVVTCPKALADLPGLLRRMLPDLRHIVSCAGVSIRVSATIGAAWLGEGVETRGELLQRADEALYEAKRRQRGAAIIAGNDELIHPPRSGNRQRLSATI